MSRGKLALAVAPHRVLHQNFRKGTQYADPRSIDSVKSLLQNVTFLDGDSARMFREAELEGITQFKNGKGSFRKKNITVSVWECVKN